MTEEQERLIEMLKLEVVFPAKSHMVLRRWRSVTLLVRQITQHKGWTVEDWIHSFQKAGLDFSATVAELARTEIGEDVTVVVENNFFNSDVTFKRESR